MADDTNFDKHSQRFKKNIYDTDKGKLRLTILLEDLYNNLPELKLVKQLSILDAGCGLGQVAASLASYGHQLTLCDLSSDLLDEAGRYFSDNNLSATFIHSSLQQLDSEHNQKYDLILFHAVLEWLEDPRQIIDELKKRLKPGGKISLMFYNKNAIVYFNVLKGNFRKIVNQSFKGHPGGLTPINPIDPSELDVWLQQANIKITSRTGIRVFYDYLSRDLKNKRSYEDILELEQLYASKPPYNMMGRYIHYVCETIE